MEVRFHHAARGEFHAIPAGERDALKVALARLEEFADELGAPHTSDVRTARNLRELRPRAGRSPWRAFYRRVGAVLYVGAFGSEARSNPRGFDRAVRLAEERLDRVEKGAER